MLSEGEDLATEFLNDLRAADRPVSDVMVSPVVTVSENTSVQTIVEMLQKQHIKRVPVLRDGRLVGIVSRADLIRALSQTPRASRWSCRLAVSGVRSARAYVGSVSKGAGVIS